MLYRMQHMHDKRLGNTFVELSIDESIMGS